LQWVTSIVPVALPKLTATEEYRTAHPVNLMLFRFREQLAATEQTVPNQLKHPTDWPTLRWNFLPVLRRHSPGTLHPATRPTAAQTRWRRPAP
jgi:hypothetical protein